jgi:hypothetical protein
MNRPSLTKDKNYHQSVVSINTRLAKEETLQKLLDNSNDDTVKIKDIENELKTTNTKLDANQSQLVGLWHKP